METKTEEFNVEQEMIKLYNECKDDRLKLDLLLQIHCVTKTLSEIKKGL